MTQRRVKLIVEFVTGTAHTGAGGVAALGHEICDDAVEDSVVVEAFARKEHEIVHGAGSFGCIKLTDEVAFVSFEDVEERFERDWLALKDKK